MTDEPVPRITDEGLRALEDGNLDKCSHIYTKHARFKDMLLVTLGVDANAQEITNWLNTLQSCACQMCRIIARELTEDE